MSQSSRVAAFGEYGYVHLSAAAVAQPLIPTSAPIVMTTSSTAVGAPGNVAITVASAFAIRPNQQLAVYGGTGTAEIVNVVSVAGTTVTATFANTHSGTYTLASIRPGKLGPVIVNNAGSAMTLTLYDGPPALAGTAFYGQTIAVIAIAAGQSYAFALQSNAQVFYTLAGTAIGDLTIHYTADPI